MGLFDSYQFEPNTYQGGGGLIDRLLAQLQTQGQYQPGQGFGSSPMEAQAAIPAPAGPPQASPIAVGNYQMPRVGAADLYQPRAEAPREAQAAPPQPLAPPQIPDFLQAPEGGHGLIGGAIRGAMANAQGGPLGIIGGAIAGGLGMGAGSPQDIARKQLIAKYQSLVPILGEGKARLAVLDPEIGKTLIADALGKQYGFTTLPDGTVVRQDPRSGTVEPVYSGGAKPTFGIVGEEDGKKRYGWIDPNKRTVTPIEPAGAEDRGAVTGPDGKPIPIPPGVDRKTFVNEVSRANAKAAAGELTEAQAKATIYASKMELAEKNLKGLDDQYTSTIGAGGYMRGTEYVPGIGNSLQSENYQKYKQARDNFITALLRQESGAAIGTSEFNRYEKELFPQPGESEAIVKQKRQARKIAIEGMKKGAGPGYKTPDFEAESGDAKADPLGIR